MHFKVLRPLYFAFTAVLILISISVWADPGLKFIENKNQWPASVDFAVRVRGGQVFLSPGQFSYYITDEKKANDLHERSHSNFNEVNPGSSHECINHHLVLARFVGANLNSIPQPYGKLDEYYNYFIGNDKTRWSSDVRAYEGVIYSEWYKGIDLRVSSQGDFFKYDFIVHPGADITQIQIEYDGADRLSLEGDDLLINTSVGVLREMKPVSFQYVDDVKRWINTNYQWIDGKITFCIDSNSYDHCESLVIDPVLIFSTYSGSTADNWGSTATPGEHGMLYSSGVVSQSQLNGGGTFPATPGAFQTSYGGLYDVAILKYDSAGKNLVYASYLGGAESESPHSLVVTKNKELMILGTTSSSNFPVTDNSYDKTYNGGEDEINVVEYNFGSDIFIAKISGDGKNLLASTFIGGSENDGLNPLAGGLVANYGDQQRGDIIVDDVGNCYISSVTSSEDFPVTNSFGLTYNGGLTDALIMSMSPDLSSIRWAAFLGGGRADASHTIQIDKSGDIFVAGGTSSINFPASFDSYQHTHAGSIDGWIAKLKGDGSAISRATLTGTASYNQIYFLDLDKDENVYVYGQTSGANFPVTANVFSNPGSGQFLQKFDNGLSTLMFSTVFGSGRGIPDISPTAFLVNDCNNIYMSGWGGDVNRFEGFWSSNTLGMPITFDAYQKTTSGSDFYFIVLSADGSKLLYSTFLGGSQSKTHVDGGTSRFDKGGIVYHAVCSGCSAFNPTGHATSDFPTTAGAWSRVNRSQNCNNAAFKFDLSLLKARIQTNSVKLNQPGLSFVCLPDKMVFQNRSTGGQLFEWNFGDNSTLVKQDTGAIIHQYKEPGSYLVKLKVTDQGTCQGRDSTKLIVNVFKPQGKGMDDVKMCFEAGIKLNASGGASYAWKAEDNSFASAIASPLVNPKETTRYFLTITDPNSCVTKDTITVRVVPGIDLKFDYLRKSSCESRPSLYVKNLTEGEEETFFDYGDGVTSDLLEDTHTYAQDGNYQIKLVGKKESCTYTSSITLPFFELSIPNVLTPALEGDNDTFKIHYGLNPISKSSLNVSIRIYNRWGKLVYHNDNYKDNWAGDDVAAGIYYYELTIEGEAECKGWVHLMK